MQHMAMMLMEPLKMHGIGKWSVYSYTLLIAHTTALQVSQASAQNFNPNLKNLKSFFLYSLIHSYSVVKAGN